MYSYIDQEETDVAVAEVSDDSHVETETETWTEPEEPKADIAAAETIVETVANDGMNRMDMKSFEKIVRSHGPRLASFVRRRIGNPSDVEDIVQDTFVEAMKGMDRYRGQSRPETWIFGIALNLIRSHYKRGRVRDMVSADEELEQIPAQASSDPARLVENRQMLERLNVICEGLSDETKQMLELVFDDCMTYEDAAEALGIPVGTIRSRISRVRLHLRQRTE